MSEMQGIARHLAELRGRMLRIVITVIAIMAFLLTFHAEPFEVSGIILYYPVPEPLHNMAAQLTEHMKQMLVPPGVQLIQTAPGQAFFAQMYVAALAALVISIPLVIREAAAFLRPALRESEVHVGRSITLPALGLFSAGCAFAYLIVIPFVLEFLYRYGESAGLITFLNVMDFVSFVLQFLLAFGISFQLPLAMFALSSSGMISPAFWRSNIRYAIIIMVVFGALVTPDGSGVTMWFIAGPMIGLYLAGMLMVRRAAG